MRLLLLRNVSDTPIFIWWKCLKLLFEYISSNIFFKVMHNHSDPIAAIGLAVQ